MICVHSGCCFCYSCVCEFVRVPVCVRALAFMRVYAFECASLRICCARVYVHACAFVDARASVCHNQPNYLPHPVDYTSEGEEGKD